MWGEGKRTERGGGLDGLGSFIRTVFEGGILDISKFSVCCASICVIVLLRQNAWV